LVNLGLVRLLLLALVFILAACGSDQGVAPEPLRFALDRLPPAYLGEPYRVEVLAQGGIRPYTYEISGKLPPGLSFKSGLISGTPKEKGSYRFEVTVKDAALSAVRAEGHRPPAAQVRVRPPPGRGRGSLHLDYPP